MRRARRKLIRVCLSRTCVGRAGTWSPAYEASFAIILPVFSPLKRPMRTARCGGSFLAVRATIFLQRSVFVPLSDLVPWLDEACAAGVRTPGLPRFGIGTPVQGGRLGAQCMHDVTSMTKGRFSKKIPAAVGAAPKVPCRDRRPACPVLGTPPREGQVGRSVAQA